MIILGIDPGTLQSGWVIFDPDTNKVVDSGNDHNETVLKLIADFQKKRCDQYMVMEMMEPIGLRMGRDHLATLVMTGRFIQEWIRNHGSGNWAGPTRQQVKMHILGVRSGDDAAVRRVVMDRFGETGKLAKGPLKGVTSHAMQALAAVLTWVDKRAT